MRKYNPALTLNQNLLREILTAKTEQFHLVERKIMAEMRTPFAAAAADLETRQAEIVQHYYNDIKKVKEGKFATNSERTNAIHIGTYQMHMRLDHLIIEGNAIGAHEVISTAGFTDICDVTHYAIHQEMQHHTYGFLFAFLDLYPYRNDEPSNGENPVFTEIIAYLDFVTRQYLHLAIEKLHIEGAFDKHLTARPFHFYYGLPNEYYYSVYVMEA